MPLPNKVKWIEMKKIVMKFVDIRNHDNVGLTMVKGVCVDDDDDFMLACKYRFFLPTSCFF